MMTLLSDLRSRWRSLFLGAGCLVLAAARASGGAALFNYPKDKPIFSLQLPEGWKADEDDSRPEKVLTFASKDGKSKYQIYLLRMLAGGDLEVGEAARQLAVATLGSNTRIGDIKYADPTDSATATGVAVGRAGATCKLAGEATFFLFAVLAPSPDRRYEAVLCAPLPLKDAGSNTFDGILHSIQPIEQPAEE